MGPPLLSPYRETLLKHEKQEANTKKGAPSLLRIFDGQEFEAGGFEGIAKFFGSTTTPFNSLSTLFRAIQYYINAARKCQIDE
jgi:hypothetical protein